MFIKCIIRRINVENQDKWYRHLERVQRAINSTHQRAIWSSPFELMFRIKMRMKEDLELLKILDEEHRDEFMLSRQKAREEAREQIFKIQDQNRRAYNKERKVATKYSAGDVVAIARTQWGPGLKKSIRFLGPYKMTSVNGHDRYDVERIGEAEGPGSTTCAADQLRP